MTALRLSPVAGSMTTAPTGARAFLAERSEGERLHAGVDLGTALAPVRAPADLEVIEVGTASYAGDEPRHSTPRGYGGYGPEWIVARDSGGLWHLFAHVSHVRVRPGERVRLGAQIATIAQRGRHLHWEIRTQQQPPSGRQIVEVALDPMAWLEGRQRAWDPHLDGCPDGPERLPLACTQAAPTPAQEHGRTWSAYWGRRGGQAPRMTSTRRRGGGGLNGGGLLVLGAVALGIWSFTER